MFKNGKSEHLTARDGLGWFEIKSEAGKWGGGFIIGDRVSVD